MRMMAGFVVSSLSLAGNLAKSAVSLTSVRWKETRSCACKAAQGSKSISVPLVERWRMTTMSLEEVSPSVDMKT